MCINQANSTTTAGEAVGVVGHKSGRRAALLVTFAAKTNDLAVITDLVVLQTSHFDLLLSVAFTLGFEIHFLLPLLLATTLKSIDEGDSSLSGHVVVGEGAGIIQLNRLFRNETLLLNRNT